MVWCTRFLQRVIVLGFVAVLAVCAPTFAVVSAQSATSEAKAPPATDPRDPDVLLARVEREGAPIWADGDTLTMVYQSEAKSIEVCCGLQEPLERLLDSDVWVLQKTVSNIDQAVISYSFVVDGNFGMGLPEVWRGRNAPEPPERADLGSLQGQLRPNISFTSVWLNEWRSLSVYLPPNALEADAKLPVLYMADGESAGAFVEVLEPLIVGGKLPPFVIVGIHSPPPPTSEDEPDLRGQEYIPSFNPKRFKQHEAFVLQEVIPWAEANLPVSKKREERAVFGYSNGGVFAAAMGLRHPDVFGHALAFSLGMEPGAVERRRAADFYLVAGTLEQGFFEMTRDLADALRDEGFDARFKSRVAGHDSAMWEEELPGAVAWAFGEGDR